MSQWTDLRDKHSALTMREKVLALVSAVIAIVFLLGNFIVEPQLKKFDKSQGVTRTITASIQETVSGRIEIENKIASDPQGMLKAELAELTATQAGLVETLAQRGTSFISSREMADKLQLLIAEQKGLKVEKVQSLPSNPILFEPQQDATQTPKPLLFRHDVEIQVSGDYFSVVKFLQRIEQQNKFLLWGDIEYAVTEHPAALVTFVVSTLSSDEEFIGVK